MKRLSVLAAVSLWLAASSLPARAVCDPRVTQGYQLFSTVTYPDISCGSYVDKNGTRWPYLTCYEPYIAFNDSTLTFDSQTCWINGAQKSSCQFSLPTGDAPTCNGTLTQGICSGTWVSNINSDELHSKWHNAFKVTHTLVVQHADVPLNATVLEDGQQICP